MNAANYQDRAYQREAAEAILREWERGIRATLLVLPTGCGKTIVFCRIIEDQVRRGHRVLILAHRGELLDQAADKLRRSTGLECAVEKAERSCLGEWFRVVVGSVQTLMSEKRLAQFPRDYFDVIIVDEAHHVLADSYRRILDYFDGAKILGVTATPDRGDMKNLGEVFESLAYEYTLPRAIKDGYLCRIKALTIPLEIDLTAVPQQNGDFQASALGSALDPYLEQIADEMRTHCQGRRTVVFLPLIATSQKMQRILADRGFRAAEVNGESRDRAEVLADWDAGRYDVLCNSMLLTEGWDSPATDCIVPLRATKVRALFAQMVGRGTRLYPGKEDLLLLDFLWNTQRLDLCRPAHLIASSPEVATKMTANIIEAGGPVDLEAAEQKAESDCIADREAALAKKLAEMRHRKRALVDPLQFEMSIAAEDLANYVPAFGWEMSPPSDKQKATLEKLGILPDEIECSGKAALILNKLDKRRSEGLTTPKQIRFLEGKGFLHVGQWEFEAARKLIDRIAGNGWIVPSGIDPATYKPKPVEKRVVGW
jgi:superfamily II DNA or RNA helicase